MAFALAVLVTGVCVFLTLGAPAARPMTAPSRYVPRLLTLNLGLILILAAAAAAFRVVSLFGPRAKDAGVRLHRRFVITFALSAMAPAVIMALFFALLITQGVEYWFSAPFRTVVDNAATVTRAYVQEQEEFMRNRMGPMADDLNRNREGFERARLQYSTLLAYELPERDVAAVYVLDGDGRVLARAEQPSAPPFLTPPPTDFAAADPRGRVVLAFTSDYIRALMRLTAYPDTYLYVARPMGEGIMAQLRRSQQSAVAYRLADRNSARIQSIFVLSYVETGLLVLVGAIWVGGDGGHRDRRARLAAGAGGGPGGGRRPRRSRGHLPRPGGDRGAVSGLQPHDRGLAGPAVRPDPREHPKPRTAAASSRRSCRR